jgi:hypothetical protein
MPRPLPDASGGSLAAVATFSHVRAVVVRQTEVALPRRTTREYSQRMMSLADGRPTFYNLDVLDDRQIG